MANPQKENGFTAIANELLEQIIHTKLNGSQLRVLLFIIRRTYGFGRKSAPMSLSFIAKGVGILRKSVHLTLRQLEDMNIISVTHESATSIQIISVEKDYQKWVSPNLGIPISGNSAVPKYDDSTVPKSGDQERNNRKKHKKETYCTCTFFERLWAEYPNKKGKARVTAKSLDAISKIGYAEMHRALERYKKSKPDWQHWQNGSTFFNSGYVDYLDASYAAEVEMEEHNGTHQNADKQQWCTDGLI